MAAWVTNVGQSIFYPFSEVLPPPVVAPPTILIVSPSKVRLNKTGAVISLYDASATWLTTTPTFTISSLSGTSIASQELLTNTTATITLNTGDTAGVITVTDPSTTDTAKVRVTSMAIPFIPSMSRRGRGR